MNNTLLVFFCWAASAPLLASSLSFNGNICSGVADGTGAFAACPNGSWINQAYGDSGLVDFTYQTSNINGTASLQLWGDPNVYSDLPKAAYGFAFSDLATITMQALGGAQVTIDTFALGTSPPAFSRLAAVSIIDLANGSVVFSTGSISVGGANATVFNPGVSSLVGLRLEVRGDMFNIGIGNFNYTESPGQPGAVPEPSPAILLSSAALLAVLHRSHLFRRGFRRRE